jgi:hypothetical protein
MVPEVVIGLPVTVSPVVLPEKATDVTVPVVELVPAPIAVRNVAASRVLTVLSAFTLRNVIAEGLVSVNRLPPTVVAPKFVRAPAASVAPVPPLATVRVPVVPAIIGSPVALVRVTAEGVPRLGVVSVGEVDSTTEPVPVDVLTPVPPLTTARVPPSVSVPLVVMGEPEKVRPVVPPDAATLVTVP